MKKILVVRNDRLGDLMLILPALRLIKTSMPGITIDCLANKNYQELKNLTPYIDGMITDDELNIKVFEEKYDCSISFFSTFSVAYKLWKGGIKKRYAPSTKLAQIFYNKKIKQRRSESIKSEYEYNNDLANFFLKDNGYTAKISSNPLVSIENNKSINNIGKKIIFIHPYTGGSSKTLSQNDFLKLCHSLQEFCDCKFILHCDHNDYDKCRILEKKANSLDMETIKPTNNLKKMFNNIMQCDLFIAGSTGPLHVAAAMNKMTVGFYPSKKSSTAIRWDTMNSDNLKLFFTDTGGDDSNLTINIPKTAEIIFRKLLS
ncbi:MAG: glycosyltransferase family 9 protein [Gammaproteobacteria bacterium]|nr:glycosyltransferase family 9 protein [Gammaproteobacteria bacterium]